MAFLALIVLMVLQGRTSRAGVAIVGCCIASLIWASATVAAAPIAVLSSLDSIRLSAWLLFAAALVTIRTSDGSGLGRAYLFGAVSFCLAAIVNDVWTLVASPDAAALHTSQLLIRIGFGVAGLLTIENFWRNTEPERRWHVWPLCVAIGGLFAYELFLFSDAFITRGRVDPGLALGRPIVAAFMAPLLALAMARNREWRVDIHVSRQVVLHTATLVASGCFLVAVAVVAILLRGFGGDWGLVLQLAMLFGSIVVLATVLSSGSARRRLKFLISRNFYTHRYDYRVEWLKFIELVSEPKVGEELSVRIICALAEFVDSPAGVLWSLSRGIGYYPTAAWKQPIPGDRKVPIDDPFVSGFRNGGWIQVRSSEAGGNTWPIASDKVWLAVPLSHRTEVIGFVVLDRATHTVNPDWEAFELLRAAGRQAASYLAEERSTKVLRDSELLTEYSKRFAFVVHDIKNLASQLNLIVSNAARHIGDPEFQRDMLRTVEDSVARMNNLLSQLKADAAPHPPRLLNPNLVVSAVAAEFADAPVAVEARDEIGVCEVTIDPERLRSALTHLVQNAVDVSCPGDRVMISSRRFGTRLSIEVTDNGPGMDDAFVRDELFLPFRSTKSGGYGIGAFQTRELIRMAGGDLEVISEKGFGTTMRITLPLVSEREPARSSAVT
ncbi:MAG: PEP-CTERM system histidine kinase PrsK [Alphaproteobacteria bacterium]|nr:PEP-CTERM system histidine kinase PrsK [Alphaproteobacteria bacterium]